MDGAPLRDSITYAQALRGLGRSDEALRVIESFARDEVSHSPSRWDFWKFAALLYAENDQPVRAAEFLMLAGAQD